MFHEFVTNQIFASVAIASVICQVWKFIGKSISKKKLDWYSLIATGGMPSSHSTFVSALAISVGIVDGFLSSIFFVAAGFAIIVVRDAFGVRHTVDKLNKNVNEIIRKKKLGINEIRQISGHTPVQALVGCLLGIVVPIAMHFLVY